MSEFLRLTVIFFFDVLRLTVNPIETLSSSLRACFQTEKAGRNSLNYDQKKLQKNLDVSMSLFCGRKNHCSIQATLRKSAYNNSVKCQR